MADTGKLAREGYGAGAIKYVVLEGFVPNPGAGIVNACLATEGYGTANVHSRMLLDGFTTNPGSGGVTSAFYILGGSILR